MRICMYTRFRASARPQFILRYKVREYNSSQLVAWPAAFRSCHEGGSLSEQACSRGPTVCYLSDMGNARHGFECRGIVAVLPADR